MNIKIPTIDQVLNRTNWTNHTLAELVSFGRVTPDYGADQWIQAMQAEQIKDGYQIPFDFIENYIKSWEKLKCEVLDRLVEIKAKS